MQWRTRIQQGFPVRDARAEWEKGHADLPGTQTYSPFARVIEIDMSHGFVEDDTGGKYRGGQDHYYTNEAQHNDV